VKKVYFLTSVVPGADIHTGFLASIKTFCRKRNAELLLLPTPFACSPEDSLPEEILGLDNILHKDFYLSKKIRFAAIPIKPQAVDPVTGLQRQSQKDGSFIFASPKQRLKLVPNGQVKYPHAMMGTGALTTPRYKDDRIGRIAFEDHVIGGLIVEVNGPTEYHFRQVQADDKGAFIDLGNEYSASGIKWVGAEVLVPGDIHAMETDPAVKAVIIELLEKFKPKYTIIHDLLSGISVNHHERDQLISRALNFVTLEEESRLTYLELLSYAKKSNKLYVVRSNHDIWIDDYVEEMIYRNEPHNYKFASMIANQKMDGRIGIEAAIRHFERRGELANVTFMQEDEDLILTPKKIQFGAHGHRGPNGSRGTLRSMEMSYGRSMSGHTHVPEILREARSVGTSTHTRLPYNKGSSSWLQTLGMTYYNGSTQLINIINGKYHT